MKLTKFFHFFQPKDKVFFELFDKITQNLVEMATIFNKEMGQATSIDPGLLETMKQFEHQNDELTHNVYLELNRNFITPFDREDIHALASGMDDIADFIYASTEYIVLYKTPYKKAYSDFSEIILEACKEIQTALGHLKNFDNNKAVEAACIKVNSLENQADRLLSQSMVDLFETNDPIKIIKASAVLENLEIATDKAESVANIIQGVMIKYS